MDGSMIFARWRQCAPHLYGLPCAHPSPQPKRHLHRFSHFCTAHRTVSHFTMALLFPSKVQNCPLPWGIWTPIEYMVPWAHPSPQPKRHLDRLSRFCRATVTDRPSVKPRYSVGNSRPHLRIRSTAMRPNNYTGNPGHT